MKSFLEVYLFSDIHGEDDHQGWTPLRYAVIEGNAQVVGELIEQRVDLEAPLQQAQSTYDRPRGTTILMEAMRTSTPAVIEILIEAKCDVKARHAEQMMSGHAKCDAMDAFHWACFCGHVENVKFWLQRFPKYDVNARYLGIGSTPMVGAGSPRKNW